MDAGGRCPYGAGTGPWATRGAATVLTDVAEGVQVHHSELLADNTTVVHGAAGVLLVDPGSPRPN